MNAAEMKAYYTDAKVAELQAAFNRVAPQPNWKTAIDVTIDASVNEVGVITEAIAFYTGSVAHASIVGAPVVRCLSVSGETRVSARITAAGYYAAIGA